MFTLLFCLAPVVASLVALASLAGAMFAPLDAVAPCDVDTSGAPSSELSVLWMELSVYDCAEAAGLPASCVQPTGDGGYYVDTYPHHAPTLPERFGAITAMVRGDAPLPVPPHAGTRKLARARDARGRFCHASQVCSG